MDRIDFTDSIYDAQQGNQSAIKFIYDNTIQLFYKEACAFMRDKNEADLAIRDAYIFIFQHLDSLEDPSKFLLWANEVCKNTCIARLKETGVFNERIPAEAANLGDILPAADYDPQINMNASMPISHIQVCLEAILDSLPDNQRACVVLWGEGYPIRSIARKLGLGPIAVNYTLAYALGNITNSVTTLGENGLKLFSMEPIPYFLWLLMSYYQYYQPQELVPGIEANFPNILRVLMPDEASVFVAEYTQSHMQSDNSRVKHVTDFSSEAFYAQSSASSSEEIDINSFIKDDSAADADAIFDSLADSIITDYDAEGYGNDSPFPAPPMDSYPAHTASDTITADMFIKKVAKAAADADKAADEQVMKEAGAVNADADTDTGKELADAAAAEVAQAAGEHPDDTAESAGADADGTAAAGIAAAPDTVDGNTAADTVGEGAAAADTAADVSVASEVSDEQSSDKVTTDNDADAAKESGEEEPKKKKKTGLIVALIIILLVLCLIAAAIFFGGKALQRRINNLLGTELFPITESVSQNKELPEDAAPLSDQDIPEDLTGPDDSQSDHPAAALNTEEESTPEETTTLEETTTEEPTTQEPTTPALLTGPPYKATIYAEWDSLGMHVLPDVNSQTLTYVPHDTEVTVTEEQDGWGHISYDDMDGWIWLGYAKLADNLQAQQPETMLEETVQRTVQNTGEAGLELRTGPADAYSTFGPIPDGTALTIEAYNYNESWAYTSYEGRYGWVDAGYLQ